MFDSLIKTLGILREHERSIGNQDAWSGFQLLKCWKTVFDLFHELICVKKNEKYCDERNQREIT